MGRPAVYARVRIESVLARIAFLQHYSRYLEADAVINTFAILGYSFTAAQIAHASELKYGCAVCGSTSHTSSDDVCN